MKVYKFGGASVKDAQGVINLYTVLETTGEKNLVVIVSAMGKMTNALEEVVKTYLSEPSKLHESIKTVNDFHLQIISDLFPNASHPIYKKVKQLIGEIELFFDKNKSEEHAFIYDQVVSYGELLSTSIVSEYLSSIGFANILLDARSCIITDANYRNANIDWTRTKEEITKAVPKKGITITQGFIGAERTNNFTTTLGREGSDYTGAIFAYCLNALDVTIWKDVPGVLNADPRYFKDPILLKQISYKEAIELAFYGASVIHPKTLQPLQPKEIPLFVKSFYNPMDEGTCVGKGMILDPMVSCFILKKDQVLISLSSLDFGFMVEDHIGDVFKWLHLYKMKVELIQNSAISFSVCIDNKYDNLEALLSKLREKFRVKWNEGVTLFTIRHSSPSEIEAIIKDKAVLLKQESRETVQLVLKD